MEECLTLVDDSKYDLSPSHVKKTTVEGILARVCLWRAGAVAGGGKAFYEKADNYAKAVYNSNKHKLNPDVFALWKNMASDSYDKTYNESIWEIEFIGTRDDGNYTESREWEKSSPKQKNYTQENYCVLRFADVLLMLAEAENEVNQGPTALAYTCVNAIRSRAGIEEVSGLSYADFQQLIRDERGRELCFESLRKYDLVRWGIYYKQIKEVMGAAVADKRWSTAGNANGGKQFVNNTTEKHQFLPHSDEGAVSQYQTFTEQILGISSKVLADLTF